MVSFGFAVISAITRSLCLDCPILDSKPCSMVTVSFLEGTSQITSPIVQSLQSMASTLNLPTITCVVKYINKKYVRKSDKLRQLHDLKASIAFQTSSYFMITDSPPTERSGIQTLLNEELK